MQGNGNEQKVAVQCKLNSTRRIEIDFIRIRAQLQPNLVLNITRIECPL